MASRIAIQRFPGLRHFLRPDRIQNQLLYSSRITSRRNNLPYHPLHRPFSSSPATPNSQTNPSPTVNTSSQPQQAQSPPPTISPNDISLLSSLPAHKTPSSATEPTPTYALIFTCKKCTHRSAHHVTKQAYHHGTVLITCPSCKNRHLMADHLKIFNDERVTVEDLVREKGGRVRRVVVQGAEGEEEGGDGDLQLIEEGGGGGGGGEEEFKGKI